MIKLVDIHKVYNPETIGQLVLKNINLQFSKNQFVAINGPSGCGKTTLMNIIGGLDKPTSGSMVIDSKLTKNFTKNEWDDFRNKKVGFIFQNYSLIGHLTIFQNISMALKIQGYSKLEIKQEIEKVLSEVGLDGFENKYPNELSGGQRQRISIARALVSNPQVILADEPTGALDKKTAEEIMDLLKSMSEDRLIIMVSHNKRLSEQYANRIIEMEDGVVLSDSNPVDKKVKIKVGKNKIINKLGFSTMLKQTFINLMNKKWRTLLMSLALAITLSSLLLINFTTDSLQRAINGDETDSENYITASGNSSDDELYSGLSGLEGVKRINKFTGIENVYLSESNEDISNGIFNYSQKFAGSDYEFNILEGETVKNDNELLVSKDIAQNILNDTTGNLSDINLFRRINGRKITMNLPYYANIVYNMDEIKSDNSNLVCVNYEDTSSGEVAKPAGWDDALLGDYDANIALLNEYVEENFIWDKSKDSLGIVYCNNYDFFKEYGVESGVFKQQGGLEFKVVGLIDTLQSVYMTNLAGFKKVQDKFYFDTEYDIFLKDVNDAVNNKEISSYLNGSGYETDFTSDIPIFASEVKMILSVIVSILSLFSTALLMTAVITAVIMIILIIYISINERRKELGVLKSIGSSDYNLKSIFTSEILIIFLIAIIFTIGLVYLGIYASNNIINGHFENILELISVKNKNLVKFNTEAFIKYSIIGFLIVMLATMYPLRILKRFTPAQLLRKK